MVCVQVHIKRIWGITKHKGSQMATKKSWLFYILVSVSCCNLLTTLVSSAGNDFRSGLRCVLGLG